ncbi:MAG TPA: hypothetical protein VMU04_24675 [Candidatus Acidoferrum sp.]|nr:hypothetical protein [Candidatus Acidoferrum sp.]
MLDRERIAFFLGVDPAPSESHKSDDGALVVGVATPRTAEGMPEAAEDWYFDFIYGRRLTWRQKATARQWSGIIHGLHRAFRFARICMDPNGGGVLIKRELIATKQLLEGIETHATPIADLVDGPTLVARADFILHMFKRGDPGVESMWPELAGDDNLNDALYSTAKNAIEHGLWALPPGVADWMVEKRAEVERWPEERMWALKNLDALASQLTKIIVATKPDGTWAFTKRNARQFSSLSKKDFVSAAMYCYAAFLFWLQSGTWRSQLAPEDAVGFSGWDTRRGRRN